MSCSRDSNSRSLDELIEALCKVEVELDTREEVEMAVDIDEGVLTGASPMGPWECFRICNTSLCSWRTVAFSSASLCED